MKSWIMEKRPLRLPGRGPAPPLGKVCGWRRMWAVDPRSFQCTPEPPQASEAPCPGLKRFSIVYLKSLKEVFVRTPHQCPVHSHQRLVVHHVSFIEHDPNFVPVSLQCLDRPAEFVADVELVSVEQEKYAVDPLSEPLENSNEVVAAVSTLLLSA